MLAADCRLKATLIRATLNRVNGKLFLEGRSKMIKRLKKNSLSDFHDAFIIAFGIRDTSDSLRYQMDRIDFIEMHTGWCKCFNLGIRSLNASAGSLSIPQRCNILGKSSRKMKSLLRWVIHMAFQFGIESLNQVRLMVCMVNIIECRLKSSSIEIYSIRDPEI